MKLNAELKVKNIIEIEIDKVDHCIEKKVTTMNWNRKLHVRKLTGNDN